MTRFRLVLCSALAVACATLGSNAFAAEAKPAAAAADVEPEAVQALTRMSAYLGTLTTFDVRAETSQDLVMTDGQKVKLDGVNRYTVRRPDAFVIEVATPWKVRRLVYDGKTITLDAPELGYYATVPAPPTIRATLDAAAAKYDLHIPLQDLFRWTDPSVGGVDKFQGAFVVGPAKIDGVDADQYAFRQEGVDWQIWIQRGDRPVPLRVVIVDLTELTRPEFEATLHWNLSPQLTADSFAFRPGKDAKPIRLAATPQPK